MPECDRSNCVPLRDYVEAQRSSDQRAVELLAKTSADHAKINILIAGLIIETAVLAVAILALIGRH